MGMQARLEKVHFVPFGQTTRKPEIT